MYVVKLDGNVNEFSRDLVGGKAYNTSILALNHLPIAKDSFAVTVNAYKAYKDNNESMPDSVKEAILNTLKSTSSNLFAVRSSATLEDAPGLSFAGQFDSFLNVEKTHVVEKVEACWESLNNDRSRAYRQAHGIKEEDAAMGVLIQSMVIGGNGKAGSLPVASGVLFTSNPLTGLRNESLIQAVSGLGDELVAGSRDDSQTLAVIAHPSIPDPCPALPPLLSAAQVKELVSLGQQTVRAFNGQPQDIEWVLPAPDGSSSSPSSSSSSICLVQTRPITSLFPLPSGPDDGRVLWSMAVTQATYSPFTPLGQSVYKTIIRGGLKGMLGIDYNMLEFVAERGFLDVSLLLDPVVGAFLAAYFGFFGVGLEEVDRTMAKVMDYLWKTRKPDRRPLTTYLVFIWKAFFAVLLLSFNLVFLFPRLFYAYINPEQAALAGVHRGEQIKDRVCARVRSMSLLELLAFMESSEISKVFRDAKLSASVMSIGMKSFQTVKKMTPAELGSALVITRGVPHNPTVEMDLGLVQLAERIRAHPKAAAVWSKLTVDELFERFQANDLPLGDHFQQFLDKFGSRGPSEIDVGRPRYREDPRALLKVLTQLCQGQGHGGVDKAKKEALAFIDRVADHLRQRQSRWAAWRFTVAARRARALVGMRELPKFWNVCMLAAVRESLLANSDVQEWLGPNVSDHLPFCDLNDLHIIADAEGELESTRNAALRRQLFDRIRQRQQVFEIESKRTQIPNIVLTDGRVFYEGWGQDDDDDNEDNEDNDGQKNQWKGEGVSPGVVRGRARVVFDPSAPGLQFERGDILVARSSDPAWTVLFLLAGGLIMETGGALVHGAVTARELGIPAVVGIQRATQFLQDGQTVEINGSTGKVKIIDEK